MPTAYETILAKIDELHMTGEDADKAAALNALTSDVVVYDEFWINERTIYSDIGAPSGEAILSGMDAFALTSDSLAPIVKRALSWMKPSEKGVDYSDAQTRQMFETLAAKGKIPQAALDALKAKSERKLTWGESVLGRPLTHLDVARAYGRNG